MAYCLLCKEEIDSYVIKCPHCKTYLDGEPISTGDTFLQKLSRCSIVSAILITVWDYHIFTSRYDLKSFGEIIRGFLLLPMFFPLFLILPTDSTFPSRIADHYGGGNSISGILIFTLISLPSAYLYSYLILSCLKRFSSYSDEGQYYPSLSFFKFIIIIFCIISALTFIKFHKTPNYYDIMMHRISCSSKLIRIGSALRMYSSANENHFPPYEGARGLRLLIDEGFLKHKDLFICPTVKFNNRWNEKRKTEIERILSDYEYKEGLSEDDANPVPICWDKLNNHTQYGNILYTDGHTKGLKGTDWIKYLESQSVEEAGIPELYNSGDRH